MSILEDLGPTFVKLGQLASAQSGHLPSEYCDALAGLRSSVAPMDAATVHAQIEEALGKPVEEIFSSFDDEPLGAASIGQVHKAELADGTVVAVKVRRPNVVETVARDFALIERVVEISEKYSKSDGGVGLSDMIEELEHTSKMELDFTNEARNLDIFCKNNAEREGVHAPTCYHEFTNEAILTEDFASGVEAGDLAYLATLDDEERFRIGELVAKNYVSQVLTDGFYHADPHSGNVLIKDDGIMWIDFGMMGTLTSKERQTLIDLVTAVLKHDSYGLKRSILQVAKPKGPIDHGALLDLCESMIDQFGSTDVEGFDLSELMSSIMNNLEDEQYVIEPFLSNLARGLVAVQGTIQTISPRVNLVSCMSEQLNMGFDPEKLTREVNNLVIKAVQGVDDLAGLPTKAVETLDMLQKSQIKIGGDFGVEGKSMNVIERMVYNVVLALMSIALFLGSCVLCSTSSTATVLNVPIATWGSFFLVAGFCLMVYVVMRMRKGK